MKEFSKNTLARMHGEDDYYVYALIDPRTYQIFYIGKGKGNRVFEHAQKAKYDMKSDDDESAKVKLIHQIHESGKDVICQICRWGLDEQTAYEVEATLIDILPGLTNIQNGHNHERGLINAEDLESKLNLSEYEEPQEKYVIIKVTEASVDRNGGLYEATRKSWCANLDKAKEYKYVLSVIYGVVQEVYEVKNWNNSSGSKRIEFEGQVCQKQSLLALKNKMIPEVYRQKGAANPFMYKKQ